MANRRSNLAVILQGLGDLPRAKELLELALASVLKTLGKAHPAVAILRFNLATLSRDEGDLKGARASFYQALTAQEASLGANHPSTAFTRASLARVLDLLGETDPAHTEAERALQAVANQPAGSRFRTRVEEIAAQILGPT